MIFEFVINAALLTSLFSLYGLLEKLNKHKKMQQILAGFLFGSIAIAGMIFPFKFENGIIYDGRSIILCLAGFFGGGTVALIAAVMSSIFRLFLGGNGVYAGVATIIVTTFIGLSARSYYKNHPENVSVLHLYLLGIVAHIGMLLSQLLIPWPLSLQVISKLWIPVLFINPIATTLIGLLLKDETERSIVKPENKLYGSRLRLLSSAINSSSNAIIISNQKGEIEWVNIGFTNQTGYSFEEALGSSLNDLIDVDKEYDVNIAINEVTTTGKPWTGEIENISKTGKIFFTKTTVTPFIDEVTGERKFISIKEDITELKKTQNELIKANQVKDGFIANISHEIRTPLNAITGLTTLIKENYGIYISEDDNIIFDGVKNASHRLIKTVEKVLDFSRLQADEIIPIKTSIDIFSLCKKILVDFEFFAKNKNIELSLECSSTDKTILADDYEINEAITNIVDNAIKFTDHGFVKLYLYKNSDGHLLLDISDTGIGIEQKHFDFIFQPYMQGEMGHLRKFEGLGLGLSITKRFIEMNNFELTVKSEKDCGSTFTINFGYPLNNTKP